MSERIQYVWKDRQGKFHMYKEKHFEIEIDWAKTLEDFYLNDYTLYSLMAKHVSVYKCVEKDGSLTWRAIRSIQFKELPPEFQTAILLCQQ